VDAYLHSSSTPSWRGAQLKHSGNFTEKNGRSRAYIHPPHVDCHDIYVTVCTLVYHKSFRTGRLERELQTVQLSATSCSCIVILWVSLTSFVAITLCVASQRVFIGAVVYFVIDPVRKLLDTPTYL